MKAINKLQRDALDMAMQGVAAELGVNIYTLRDSFFERDKAMEYGVNWSAQGTQDAETTLAYAQKLTKAAEICKVLNSLEMATNYADDPQPESLETFKKKAEDLKNIILMGVDAEFVELAIDKIQ